MLSQLWSILSRKKSPEQSTTQSSASSESSASSPVPSLGSSSNPSWISQATERLKIDEDLVLHAYQDHLGYWTIGYGRLIDKRKGGGITKDEAAYLFNNDVNTVLEELRWKLVWFDHLTDPRKAVLLNMAYQLGVPGLLGFKRTLAMIQTGDYEAAAANMLKSKWASQTPARAKRMAEQMRTNEWQS